MSEISVATITRLVVKNYRSLADVDIALAPLTVFVGQNGSGKSNVIDVLRFVRDALTEGFDCALAKRGGLSELRCWFADESEEVSIRLHFEGAEWSGEYGFGFGQASRGAEVEIKWEKLSIKEALSEQRLFFEVREGKLVSAAETLVLPPTEKNCGLYSLSRRTANSPKGHPMQDFRNPKSEIRGCASSGDPKFPLPSRVLTLSQLNDPRVQPVRDFLAHMNFYDLSPDLLRKPQPVLPPFPLLETGENLASALREMQERKDDDLITDALEVIVEGLDGYLVERMNGHLVTKLHYTYPAVQGARKNKKVRQFNSHLTYEADGIIRMLGILTALYQERYPSPLVIEEPEKAIYPGALAVLSDVLKEVADSSQVLVTTHRAYFINDFSIDSLLVVEKEDAITKIGPVISEQRQIIAEKMFLPGELMQMEGLFREGASLIVKV